MWRNVVYLNLTLDWTLLTKHNGTKYINYELWNQFHAEIMALVGSHSPIFTIPVIQMIEIIEK